MREAIINRISRRKYDSTPISIELISKINEKIHSINTRSGLSVEFCENGTDVFSSMLKTYGMFSGVRSIIIMKGKADDKDLAEKIGYYGESLVLDLTDMGLGTCWVAGTFDRKKISVPKDEKMLCVITVGYCSAQSSKEKFLRRSISKNRKSAEQRLKGYSDAPDWAKNGIKAVQYAPSAVNSQKPYFTYCDNMVIASVPDNSTLTMIDLGIAKLHFETEAGGTFRLGNNAVFTRKL